MATPTFSYGCDFVMGLGKAHLPANLEVAIFIRCRNIKGEPQNFRKLPEPMTMPTFSSRWDFMMGLGKAHLPANLEVVTFSRCRNIKKEPQAMLNQSSSFFLLQAIFPRPLKASQTNFPRRIENAGSNL